MEGVKAPQGRDAIAQPIGLRINGVRSDKPCKGAIKLVISPLQGSGLKIASPRRAAPGC
jgi:hypothetical protein